MLAQQGVDVIWAEGLLSYEDGQAIDAFNDQYMQNWFRVGGVDVSKGGGFSLGEMFGYLYSKNYGTAQVVRFGEICRRVLDLHPHARAIVTDIKDGSAVFIDHGTDAVRLFRLSVLKALATDRNLECLQLALATPVPCYHAGENDMSLVNVLRRFAGGFRPRYLLPRLTLPFRRKQDGVSRIYIFLNHGIRHVAKALSESRHFEVFVDQGSLPEATALRYDHFIGVPRWETVKAGWRLVWHVSRTWPQEFLALHCTHNGVDYGHFLQTTARSLVYRLTASTLYKVGQVLRMLKALQPDVIVINGESSIQARALIAEARDDAYKVYFFRHGYTTYRSHFFPTGHNNPHVTYLANGSDHVLEYGTHLPADRKPRVVTLPNPATTDIFAIRNRRKLPAGKRVLVLNFTSSFGQTSTRSGLYDAYTVGILEAARSLTKEGYTFSFRPHVGDNIDYLNFAFQQMNISEGVDVNSCGSFHDALLAHDIVIVNVSSCHYQALFAGWPTIFFEPDYDARNFIGLPGATDVQSPIADTPAALADMVRECEDPDSWISRFPLDFSTHLAARFVGEDAGNAAGILADFFTTEILATRPHVAHNNQSNSSKDLA